MEQPPQMQPPSSSPEPSAPAQMPGPAPVMDQQPSAPPYAPAPGMMAPAPPRRGRGPVLAIVLIVALVLLGGGGYLVGGFVVAQGKLDAASKAYNGVIDRENKLTDLFNGLTTKINAVDPSNATKDTVAQAKTLFSQLVTQSQEAQSTIEGDQAALASSDSNLKDSSWLTALSSSSINNQLTKNDYLASAVGVAKTITTDYVQFGNFEVAYLNTLADLIAVGDASDAHDLTGATAAAAKMKSDVDNAVSLDHAPGLSTQMDGYMHDLQAFASDFVALFAAAAAGDQNGVNRAADALNRDGAKVDADDWAGVDTQANNFYGNLIDQYNSFIDKANKVSV